MDQNQTTVDNDLQKAIDDITNTTNGDPVFSDPVAAPSSVPEGDTGELGEPVGPFPEPKLETPPMPPMPQGDSLLPPSDTGAAPIESAAPTEPLNIPDLNIPDLTPPPSPAEPTIPDLTQKETPAPEAPEIVKSPEASDSSNLNMHQIKEAALRDLVPLLDHLNMSPSQRFGICRNIFEDLRDYTVLEQAYRAASEIPDETERAEALLYLVESIDKM